MKTNSKERKLKKAIIKSTNAIRKKYRDLQQERLTNDKEFRIQYKPIIDPINKLIENTDQLSENKSKFITPLQEERSFVDLDTNEIFPDYEETPKNHNKNKIKRKLIFDEITDDIAENHDDDLDQRVGEDCDGSHANGNRSKTSGKLTSLDSLPDFLNIINTKNHDSRFGVRKFRNDYMIGQANVKFTNNGKISVKKKSFNLTTGLNNLLFLKNPDISYCTETDFLAYKEILMLTNAHKNAKYISKNKKYSEIILPLFKSGGGVQTDFMLFSRDKQKIEYTYWDDPNELVDRLRLLLSSKSAGHNAHNNEIISIIEELKEADIIY